MFKSNIAENNISDNDIIDNNNFCGEISKELFSINIPVFMESLKHNTCLNRKVSIDIDGNIKNCPSMKNSFGNIKYDKIEDVIKTIEFKKNWFIHKDLIDICKDCEFRRVCTDCRGFVEEPNNQLSKPLKCGYSPKTNEWEDWSVSPFKKNSIKFYGIK